MVSFQRRDLPSGVLFSMRGKIERPNGVSLFKELLFIRPYILGPHPTLNQKKNLKDFLKS
jgi:hypothetical protein